MAKTITIPKGNRSLQDVLKTKPDTKVNFNAALYGVKYPTIDILNGMFFDTSFEDYLDGVEQEDPIEFYNPHQYVDPDEKPDQRFLPTDNPLNN